MVTTLVYSDQRYALHDATLDDLANLRTDPSALLWVDLSDPTPEETKRVLEDTFAFHPLAVEDCVSDSPYPKVEAYEDFVYIVLHVLLPGEGGEFTAVELDAFMGKGYLVTYHRASLPALQATFQRYARPGGPVVRGPDRFFHALFEACVAGDKPCFDAMRRAVEQVQSDVLNTRSPEEVFPKVAALRKKLSKLRQFVRPQQAIATELAHGKHKIVRAALVPYFRDLAEELSRLESETAGLSEQLILSFRIYLNKSSHEANGGIRILTGITALTFPMLLVGSWFGMNFQKMDELHTTWGYGAALAITLVGTVATAGFMRRKRWL